jgi:hypothetical protein
MESINTSTRANPAHVQVAPVTKERRSWTARFEDGAGARLEVRAERRRDGTARTFVKHVVGTGKSRKSARGATATHATVEAARTAMEQLAASARRPVDAARGPRWLRREARRVRRGAPPAAGQEVTRTRTARRPYRGGPSCVPVPRRFNRTLIVPVKLGPPRYNPVQGRAARTPGNTRFSRSYDGRVRGCKTSILRFESGRRLHETRASSVH